MAHGLHAAGTGGELSSDDWSIPWGLESDTSERLDRLGRVLNATYFAVRLAGLIPVCAMATGQDKVLLAAVRSTPDPGRTPADRWPLYQLCPLEHELRLELGLPRPRRPRASKASWRPEKCGSSLFASHEELKAQGIEEPRPLLLVHKSAKAPVRFGDLKLTWSNQNWHPMRPGIMVRFDEIQERDGCLSVFDARVYSTELMREFVDCLAGFIQSGGKGS